MKLDQVRNYQNKDSKTFYLFFVLNLSIATTEPFFSAYIDSYLYMQT